jgi:hypothetical protein
VAACGTRVSNGSWCTLWPLKERYFPFRNFPRHWPHWPERSIIPHSRPVGLSEHQHIYGI